MSECQGHVFVGRRRSAADRSGVAPHHRVGNQCSPVGRSRAVWLRQQHALGPFVHIRMRVAVEVDLFAAVGLRELRLRLGDVVHERLPQPFAVWRFDDGQSRLDVLVRDRLHPPFAVSRFGDDRFRLGDLARVEYLLPGGGGPRSFDDALLLCDGCHCPLFDGLVRHLCDADLYPSDERDRCQTI